MATQDFKKLYLQADMKTALSAIDANKMLDDYRKHYGHQLDAYRYMAEQHRRRDPWRIVDETLQREARKANVELVVWKDAMNRRLILTFKYMGRTERKEYDESDLYDAQPDEVLADLLGTLLVVQGK